MSEENNTPRPRLGKEAAYGAIGVLLGIFALVALSDLIQLLQWLIIGEINLYGEVWGWLFWDLFRLIAFSVPAYIILKRHGRPALAQIKGIRPKPQSAHGDQAQVSTTENVPVQASSEFTLRDLHAQADDVYASVDVQVDKMQIAYEKFSGQEGLGPALGILVSGFAQGRNFLICALAIEGASLVRYEAKSKSRQKKAHAMIQDQSAPLKRVWDIPLAEAPTNIEVGSAGNHIADVSTDAAARVEDVFFMYRGRRMVIGRYFNHVRDSATVHQYEVRDFILEAKKRLRTESKSAVEGNQPDTSQPTKGFDI